MNDEAGDKRYQIDRRVNPTPFLSRYVFTGGRRKAVRREQDKRKHIFVDLYDTRLFIAIIALLVMNVLDGYLTLLLISENVIVEANPFMAFCLDFGQAPFFWVKYALMAVSLLIFCIFRSFRFSNVALAGSIMLYGSVVLYQVHLVYQHAHQLFR